MPETTLVTAQWLAEQLDHCRVLDCRAKLGVPDHGRQCHAQGHIPGAVHADLDQDLAAPPSIRGRHPLPERATWLRTCRRWGISEHTQVVAYDDAGGAFAARAWWMLRWLGHDAVAVLDGGWQAWGDVGGQTSVTVAHPQPGNISDRAPLTRQISAQDLAGLLPVEGNHPDHVLLDARAPDRFAGEAEPIDHTAGHIPSAQCMPHTGNLNARGQFKSVAELAERFSHTTDNTICYCGSGVTAAHNVLAMRHAGRPEPMLYVGSWSEWIEDPSRPIATAE